MGLARSWSFWLLSQTLLSTEAAQTHLQVFWEWLVCASVTEAELLVVIPDHKLLLLKEGRDTSNKSSEGLRLMVCETHC